MYENITYEIILKRMLDAVRKKNATLDTREGSVVYNALAPAAVELQNMYIQLDGILNESFADTASRTYLIKRAAERGIKPEVASKAILKGEFNIDVPLGERFSQGDLNYRVVEKISNGTYKLACETAGIIGNAGIGTLLPLAYIAGLTLAKTTKILIPGQDEEPTESFRKRYFESLKSQSYGGNISDYKVKTKAVEGVGGVKVYPTFNGAGTVKLMIIDAAYTAPSSTLIAEVQQAIDPKEAKGQGKGIAPIGHSVTVEGVKKTSLDIYTTITYQKGFGFDDVKVAFEALIDDYFLELSKIWEDRDNLIVRISQIETRLLNLVGIVDVENTKINGEAANFMLKKDNIPKRGRIISG